MTETRQVQIQTLEAFGEVPLDRFSHTVTQISKKTAILFGGATGEATGQQVITDDTYHYDIVKNQWKKLHFVATGVQPPARAAHASAKIENDQMVIFGGAKGGGGLVSDELYMLDARNGEDSAHWMTIPVIGKTPGRRYGHTLVYIKPHIVVFGGNTGSGPVNDLWTLDTEVTPFQWTKIETTGAQPAPRDYHTAAVCTKGTATGMMVIHGGRPLGCQSLGDTWGLRRHRNGKWDWIQAPTKETSAKPSVRFQHKAAFIGTLMVVQGGRAETLEEGLQLEVYDTETSLWKKFDSISRFRHSSWIHGQSMYVYGGFDQAAPTQACANITKLDLALHFQEDDVLCKKVKELVPKSAKSPRVASRPTSRSNNPTRSRIVVTAAEVAEHPASGVAQVEDASRHQIFLNHLLRPQDWLGGIERPGYFAFRCESIIALVDEAIAILKTQSTLIRIDTPLVKVFGDIHGQYQDIMRFFHLWGSPDAASDIEPYEYLFLGDYVDRGNHSLETICMLIALKIKYPERIHLIRGNHEDRRTNSGFGFYDECQDRLCEDSSAAGSVWNKINEFFDWLPLAAVIEDKIVCVHGGIGSSLQTLSQIEAIQRPIQIEHEVCTPEQQLVIDILWSDPTESDFELGIQPNLVRDPHGMGNIVEFGPDRVEQFLRDNGCTMILRAHECVQDGFERFAGGKLFTIFSATDYCGKHKNAGAMIQITKQYELIPKMIYPLNNAEENWITDPVKVDLRPPTPPKWQNVGARKKSFD